MIAVDALAPEARLLILCSRLTLDADCERVVDHLLAQELDWSALLAAADAHYIVPLLARHLLAQDRVPPSAHAELRERQRRCAIHALQLVRVQQQLTDVVFAPRSVPHAFFKGAALAQRYYGDAAQRQYRDVDVLVDAGRIAEVGHTLLALGYEVTNPAWETFRQRDLEAFCRYQNALELRSPKGVQVELHKFIDSTGCIFSSPELLSAASVPAGSQYPWRMLAPADMFVYLCYHHARHRWSSLHWCADIEVLMRHPDFDPAAVRRRAAGLALERTLEETVRLGTDLRLRALGNPAAPDRLPSLFLHDCLASVQQLLPNGAGAAAVGIEDASPLTTPGAEREPDFLYDWQFSARYRRRFRLRRWQPSVNDVNAWPLPLRLHWMYYLMRPIRIAGVRLLALFRGRTPGTARPDR